MDNLEEILAIIELLNSCAIVDIKSNKQSPSSESVNIDSYLTYSQELGDYVMVCLQDHEELDLVKLEQQSSIKFNLIEPEYVSIHYPVRHEFLSPLNIVDVNCRRTCSILMFSNTLNHKDILVSFTHSEGKMEIPFMELKIILEVSGAKIRQYNP
jgi:hypothetical protein